MYENNILYSNNSNTSVPVFVVSSNHSNLLVNMQVYCTNGRMLFEFLHMYIIFAFGVMKENGYKFPVPLLPAIFYTSALRSIRTSSLVFPISYESYRFILSNFFLVHKNRIKCMRAACARKYKYIYICYILLYGQQDKSLVHRIHNKIYDCDNGGFVVKQGYYTSISPRCTDNKTDEKMYTFKIENRSPNINVYLFLGLEIFKTVRAVNAMSGQGGVHEGSISVVVIKYAQTCLIAAGPPSPLPPSLSIITVVGQTIINGKRRRQRRLSIDRVRCALLSYSTLIASTTVHCSFSLTFDIIHIDLYVSRPYDICYIFFRVGAVQRLIMKITYHRVTSTRLYKYRLGIERYRCKRLK